MLEQVLVEVIGGLIVVGLVAYLGSPRFKGFVRRTYRRLVANWQLVLALLFFVGAVIGAVLLVTSYWPLLLVMLALTVANALFGNWLYSRFRSSVASSRQEMSVSSGQGALLKHIRFDYQDDPSEHGWRLGGPPPSINHISDDVFQDALEIVPSGRDYHMDFDVTGDVRTGTRIEFAAKPHPTFRIYAQVDPQPTGDSGFWLKFMHGSGSSQRVSEREWLIYIKPDQEVGDWGIYRVDLKETVRETVAASEGWHYGSLEAFRLRGHVSIAYISVFRAWAGSISAL